MAPRTLQAMLGLALLGSTAVATAANALGSAVAGAPSLFVLAVAESRADDREAKAAAREREPRPATAEQAREGKHQAAAPPNRPPRAGDDEPSGDRKLTLR